MEIAKEYIEREALLKDFEEEKPTNWTDSESERQAENDFYKYRDIVKMQTTADVVEVVRCKDCGMSRETEDGRYLFCMQFADTVGFRAFCSYGVRKEGAEE